LGCLASSPAQRYTTSTDPEVTEQTKTASIQLLVHRKFVIMEKNMEGRNYFVTETKTVVLDARSCLCVCSLDVGALCRVHGEFSKTLPSLVR